MSGEAVCQRNHATAATSFCPDCGEEMGNKTSDQRALLRHLNLRAAGLKGGLVAREKEIGKMITAKMSVIVVARFQNEVDEKNAEITETKRWISVIAATEWPEHEKN